MIVRVEDFALLGDVCGVEDRVSISYQSNDPDFRLNLMPIIGSFGYSRLPAKVRL